MDYLDLFLNHKGLMTTHLNVRSIWNKIDLLRNTFTNNNVDIITFSESWLTSNIPDELIDIKGYNVIRNDRNWHDEPNSTNIKKGGGVCMYLKDCLKYKVDVLPKLTISSRDIECQNVELLLTNQKNVLIVSLYRPPNGNIETFSNIIEAALHDIDLPKKDVIILGDFNFDFLVKSNADTKCITRLISSFGLTKLINGPTRYSATKNSCIDQIVTDSNHIQHAGVADLNISDHQLIYFVKKKNKEHSVKISFEGRSYRNYDDQIFKNNLD